MNFKYIRNFFDTDERFSYMHDLLENKMDVHIANGQSFIIIQEKYSLFKAIYALPDNPFLKVSSISVMKNLSKMLLKLYMNQQQHLIINLKKLSQLYLYKILNSHYKHIDIHLKTFQQLKEIMLF